MCTILVLVRTDRLTTPPMPMGDIPVNKQLRWKVLLVMILMYTGGVASQIGGTNGMWLAWLFTVPAGLIWWSVTSDE